MAKTAAKTAAPARARATQVRLARSVRAQRHRSASAESFLREQGLYERASARAIKEVIVWQVERAMERRGITKAAMARLMGTSRSALDRLLDPENDSVRLSSLFRAADVLGSDLRVEL